MPLFSLRDVEQVRAGRRTLCGISLDVAPRTVLALVGPSGAGKTSLIRLLDRLDDPASGTILFDGAPIDAVPVRVLRRRVGFVFQQPVMFEGTVAANLETARAIARVGGPAPAVDAATAVEMAEALRLAGLDASYLDRTATALSGGERQRVSIARALMTRPEVLLLDEPTSALDPEVADRLMATVRELAAATQATVVMVTHRLSEARAASTHTAMLEAGRLVEMGETARMFEAPAEARTREYLLGRGAA